MDLREFSMMAFRLSVAPNVQETYHRISEMVLIEISPAQMAHRRRRNRRRDQIGRAASNRFS
ncbi:hypothetical protein C8N30_2546 [Sulfitobacter guttiformis]|uniref:Uncharacterized protein n=1 Tax=Sulfitobacter guttiformis TaxID=74349 RepID=A0A420DUR5_9RHOB|nr:hypothetical protein C8N30_2546 [Sulfitobacter guttiformis]